MGYAVELFFDHESELAVRTVWNGVAKAVGRPSLSDIGARPHVSLAVYGDGLDTNGFQEKLLGFAESTECFEFRLSSIGTFPGSEGVVFLTPVVTRQLIAIHERFHEVFSRYSRSAVAYYFPGDWVPHCTVAIDLAAIDVTAAVAYCREVFKPVTGRFREIGLVEFHPVKELFTADLGQDETRPK